MESKKCLTCSDSFMGRSDKKFCSDYCRNTYNNQMNKDANALVKRVNHTLRKNRRILESILSDEGGNVRVKKKILMKQGFDFNYYTNRYQTKYGKEYLYNYDFGVRLDDDESVLVVKAFEDVLS